MCDCLNVTLSETASSDRRAENMRAHWLCTCGCLTNQSCVCFGILLHLQTCRLLIMLLISVYLHHILDVSHFVYYKLDLLFVPQAQS